MEKEKLTRCRKKIVEVKSIDAAIIQIDTTLSDIPSPKYDGMPHDHTCAKNYKLEASIDAKNALLGAYSAAKREAIRAIAEAEEEISKVQHSGTRAALRYYYIGGVRTWDEVSGMVYCSGRTLRYWLQRVLSAKK